MLYRFFIGYRCHFQDPSKPAQTKLVKPIRKVIGFSRLACRERSERNAKREKTYIIFAGGTEAKNQQSISEGNTAYPLFTGGTEVNNQQSISEGNTAYSLFTGGTEVNNQTIHFRRKYLTLFIID